MDTFDQNATSPQHEVNSGEGMDARVSLIHQARQIKPEFRPGYSAKVDSALEYF